MVAVKDVKVYRLTCLRCSHVWISRQRALPKRCARCGSPYWDTPKRHHAEPHHSGELPN